LARSSGWRRQALQNLQSLAHLETPRRDLVELRSEAIACLGGFDAHEEARLLRHTQSVWSLDFSPDGALLATAGYDGRLQLWDVKDHRQMREVTDPDVNLAKRHNNLAMLPAVRFRPDGSYLAYATWKEGSRLLDVREANQQRGTVLAFPAPPRYFAFDNKGRLFAASWGDGRVGVYEAGTQTLKRTLQTNAGQMYYFPVALSPDGDLLAAIGPQNAVQLYTVADDQKPIILGRVSRKLNNGPFDRKRFASATPVACDGRSISIGTVAFEVGAGHTGDRKTSRRRVLPGKRYSSQAQGSGRR